MWALSTEEASGEPRCFFLGVGYQKEMDIRILPNRSGSICCWSTADDADYK